MDFEKIKNHLADGKVQIALLILTLALAIATNNVGRTNPIFSSISVFLGLLVAVEMVVFVAIEMKIGATKQGLGNEIKDTIIALLAAIILWYGASAILNTSTPISAVVSCSMLPNLERGDFVIVQNTPIRAPVIELTKREFEQIGKNSTVYLKGTGQNINGSAFSSCLSKDPSFCDGFREDPRSIAEINGPIKYNYDRCELKTATGETYKIPCIGSLEIKGKKITSNFSNDVIVYTSPKEDLYSKVGDIVHRTFVILDVEGKQYYLTKGDNNPVLDIQAYDSSLEMGNGPVSSQNLRGKVILRVPYIGYLKLFLSGFLREDNQCKTQLTFDHY
ncbi:hypothetical protein HY990_05245 [Candidatus Micrarchaeota archaeon]|nr:hypothetical protein [Candidatus Micrarchaeota archaeon]